MSDTMKSICFEKIIKICLEDYYSKGKIFEIDEKHFYRDGNDNRFLLGPAAGPHTQLAQNILSAYLTGSRFFELKTVQVVDGKQMQEMIAKPCIDVRNVGYNVEWSTELTVEDARREYTMASILLQVMAIELALSDKKDFVFNISVGYDLKGIQSKKISDYIDDLKESKDTEIFKECIDILKRNINKFRKFKLEDIDKISSQITDTITLSTMHGCKATEILDMGKHLIVNKKMNTFIKCNPTLLGYKNVRDILDNLGYNDVIIRKEDFDNDLQFNMAKDVISELLKSGKEDNLLVGVKLTNTLPVYNNRKVLPGESMYMSGKPLYPIAMGVAEKIANAFSGDIHISMSGGIDKNNVLDVLKTGIAPITFSTLLLKPRGYMNTRALLDAVNEAEIICFEKIDVDAISELAKKAKEDINYKNKGDGKILEDKLPIFDCFKNKCGICVDVCPNRANIKVCAEGFIAPYQIVHIENMCNECGNCHVFCTKGGFPYLKKITLFNDLEEFKDSENSGFLRIDENKFLLRNESKKEYEYEYDSNSNSEKNEIEKLLEAIVKDYPYLIK